MTHTPIPYHVTPNFDIRSGPQGGLLYVSVAGARGRSEKEASANAAFIVRACNNHDALVAALTPFAALLEYPDQCEPDENGMVTWQFQLPKADIIAAQAALDQAIKLP